MRMACTCVFLMVLVAMLGATVACGQAQPPADSASTGRVQSTLAPTDTPEPTAPPPTWQVSDTDDWLRFSIIANSYRQEPPLEAPKLMVICDHPEADLPHVLIDWGGAHLSYPKRGPRSTSFYVSGVWAWGDNGPKGRTLFDQGVISGVDDGNQATKFTGRELEDFFRYIFTYPTLTVDTIETEQLGATFDVRGLRELMEQHGAEDRCPYRMWRYTDDPNWR